MALKAIFFDAAGTLFKTVRPVGEIYASFAREYGMDVSASQLAERFRLCFSSSPPLAFPGTSPDAIPRMERDWWKQLVREIFAPYGEFSRFDAYFSTLFEHFSKPRSWTLYPETAQALAALEESGLTQAVITNFDSRVIGILEGLGISARFDSILLSSRVGYAKPAPQIFQQALAHYKLPAHEALHVGDSPQHDVAGAAAAGLRAVLVDRHQRHTTNSCTRIQNLKELLPLIHQLS